MTSIALDCRGWKVEEGGGERRPDPRCSTVSQRQLLPSPRSALPLGFAWAVGSAQWPAREEARSGVVLRGRQRPRSLALCSQLETSQQAHLLKPMPAAQPVVLPSWSVSAPLPSPGAHLSAQSLRGSPSLPVICGLVVFYRPHTASLPELHLWLSSPWQHSPPP